MQPWRVGLVALFAIAGGCSRASWSGPITTPAPGGATVASASVAIEAPPLGATVYSPIEVSASARSPAGTQVAAVLSAIGPGGGRRWLAAAELRRAAEGSYRGSLAVSDTASGAAELEVVVSRTADGTVLARHTIPVTLASRP